MSKLNTKWGLDETIKPLDEAEISHRALMY